jgi:hypothetical protein
MKIFIVYNNVNADLYILAHQHIDPVLTFIKALNQNIPWKIKTIYLDNKESGLIFKS